MTRQLQQIRDSGFTQVKIKVGRQVDWSALKRAKSLLKDSIAVRVDANCAWDHKEAINNIRELGLLGIHSIEQPLPPDDIEGLVKIKRSVPCQLIVDESLSSIQSAEKLASMGACDIFNIRLSKCGGY